MSDKQKKWDGAYKNANIANALPAQVLAENDFLLNTILDKSGSVTTKKQALDLACGRAGNALFLARRNYEVDAIDISSNVLEHVNHYAKEESLNISCIQRDVEKEGLSNKKYDVIVASYFLNRELFPQIVDALKPKGLLFYQTWSQVKCGDAGPSNPAFRLANGELLELCDSLDILLYQQYGTAGDVSNGLRNESLVIAQKN